MTIGIQTQQLWEWCLSRWWRTSPNGIGTCQKFYVNAQLGYRTRQLTDIVTLGAFQLLTPCQRQALCLGWILERKLEPRVPLWTSHTNIGSDSSLVQNVWSWSYALPVQCSGNPRKYFPSYGKFSPSMYLCTQPLIFGTSHLRGRPGASCRVGCATSMEVSPVPLHHDFLIIIGLHKQTPFLESLYPWTQNQLAHAG